MKTLEQIKEEYAKELGYRNWLDAEQSLLLRSEYVNEIAQRYATEYEKEALRLASERVKTFKSGNSGSWYDARVDKQSILNEYNLPKHE